MVYNAFSCPVDHSRVIFEKLKKDYSDFLFNRENIKIDILIITVQENSTVSNNVQQIIKNAKKDKIPVFLAYIRKSDQTLQLYHLSKLDENLRVVFGARLFDGLKSIIAPNSEDTIICEKYIGVTTSTLYEYIEKLTKRIESLENSQIVFNSVGIAKNPVQKVFKHNKKFLILI